MVSEIVRTLPSKSDRVRAKSPRPGIPPPSRGPSAGPSWAWTGAAGSSRAAKRLTLAAPGGAEGRDPEEGGDEQQAHRGAEQAGQGQALEDLKVRKPKARPA